MVTLLLASFPVLNVVLFARFLSVMTLPLASFPCRVFPGEFSVGEFFTVGEFYVRINIETPFFSQNCP